jgi:hypothetical protein
MFFAFFGRHHKATVQANTGRSVRCENCGANFSYQYSATGVGRDGSAYFMDNEGAATRAATQAKKRLKQELTYGTSMVPCPQCGWFQKKMVREMRLSRPLSISCGVWLALLGLIFLVVASISFSATSILLGFGLLFTGSLIAILRAFNPNWRSPSERKKHAQRYWQSRARNGAKVGGRN